MKNVNAFDTGSKSLQELQNQIIEYQRKNEELNNRNARLYDYIRELERDEGESYLLVMEEREKFATFAGLRTVKNDGVVITLSPIGDTIFRMPSFDSLRMSCQHSEHRQSRLIMSAR